MICLVFVLCRGQTRVFSLPQALTTRWFVSLRTSHGSRWENTSTTARFHMISLLYTPRRILKKRKTLMRVFLSLEMMLNLGENCSRFQTEVKVGFVAHLNFYISHLLLLQPLPPPPGVPAIPSLPYSSLTSSLILLLLIESCWSRCWRCCRQTKRAPTGCSNSLRCGLTPFRYLNSEAGVG